MPAVSLLGFMDVALTEDESKAEHERQKMYLEYQMLVHSRAPQTDKESKAQQKFAKELRPKEFAQSKKGPAKVYKWDNELLNRLKAKQNKNV